MGRKDATVAAIHAIVMTGFARLLRPVRWVAIATCIVCCSAFAQQSGSWSNSNPTSNEDSSSASAPRNTAIQTHQDDGSRTGSMSFATPRGMYELPQGARELWPECEAAINAMRDALALRHSLPAVVVVTDDGPRGYYADGVITIRKDAGCSVLVHELVHHAQYLRLGPARSADEWHRREQEAKRIEHVFRDRDKE